MRPTWCDIDLGAIRHNVGVLSGLVPGGDLCAVVKANAYGHGATAVALAAVEAGARWLGVALVDEAAELRAAGLDVPILLFSEPRPGEMADVAALGGVRPTVYTTAGIDAFAAAAPGAPVHLKIDTGMHRVGARPPQAVALADHLAGAGLVLEGLMTHLAVADRPDDPFNETQLDRFDAVLADLAAAGHRPSIVHAANTATTLSRPGAHRTMVRTGIGIYGVEPAAPFRDQCADLGLRPAARLRSEVAHLQEVEAGEGVSYSHRWTADRLTRLATVPIGYADGIARGWWDGGVVLIGGQRRPIRGVVTMDQMVVEVDDGVQVGDEVVLLGSQGDETLRVPEVAQLVGTIGYEVLTSLGVRIPRRYHG
jgi:alanine racemase